MGKEYTTVITGSVPTEWCNELAKISEIIIWPGNNDYLMPKDEVIRNLQNTDALINFAEVKTDREFLANASRLKIIANASKGFDNLDLEELSKRKIWASNSPGFFNY